MIQPQTSGVPVRSPDAAPVVLVVDDDPAVLAALRRLLASEPVQVVTSEHPKLALRWILRQEVGLVISDRRMAEMPGDRFLCSVRRLSPRTGLLLLTAFPEAGAGPPFVEMLSKPWDPAGLKKAVRRLLRERDEAFGEGIEDGSDPEGGRSA